MGFSCHEQVVQFLLDCITKVWHLNQVFAQCDRVKWDVISQAIFVLLHGAVLALELEHLFDENFLVGQAEQEVAVVLELW